MAQEEEQLGRPIIWRPATKAALADTEEEEERCLQPPFAVIASSLTDLSVGRYSSNYLLCFYELDPLLSLPAATQTLQLAGQLLPSGHPCPLGALC